MYQRYYYYFDNTPTFGFENDSIGAIGYLEGTVVDNNGQPVSGLEIIYDYREKADTAFYVSVISDSNGYFIIKDMAKMIPLSVMDTTGNTRYLQSAQIYPNDTTTVKIIYTITAIKENNIVKTAGFFTLNANYPNPFNNSTTFKYTLSKREYIEISIYDLRGRLVDQLFSGFKNKGKYNMTWRAKDIPSGIYIIQLSSPTATLTQKCVYLK